MEICRRESSVLRHISSPYVIKWIDYVENQKYAMLVLELAEKDLLTREQQSVIELDQAKMIMEDLLKALNDIHRQGFVHRNIEPSNIVFTHTQKLKVTDFGLAEHLGHQHYLHPAELNPKQLTGHEAPELIQNKIHNTSADIWSAGCVFFQLFYNRLPFDITSAATYISDIRARCMENGKYSLPQDFFGLHSPQVSLALEHFFSIVFQVQSGNRPTAQQLLKHYIFHQDFGDKLRREKSQTNKTARIDSRLQPTHLSQMSNYAKTVSEVSCVDSKYSHDYFRFKWTYMCIDNLGAFDDDYFRKKISKFKCMLLAISKICGQQLFYRLKTAEHKSKSFIQFKKSVERQTKDMASELEYVQFMYFQLYPYTSKIPHFKQFSQYESILHQQCTQLSKAALVLSQQQSLSSVAKTNLLIVSLRITLLFIINFRSVYSLKKLSIVKEYLAAQGQIQLNAQKFNAFLQSLYITKVVLYLTEIEQMCRQT